jgi:hypothetical protein
MGEAYGLPARLVWWIRGRSSLARFVGVPDYGPDSLSEDFTRSRFLLGFTDGAGLFTPDDAWGPRPQAPFRAERPLGHTAEGGMQPRSRDLDTAAAILAGLRTGRRSLAGGLARNHWCRSLRIAWPREGPRPTADDGDGIVAILVCGHHSCRHELALARDRQAKRRSN